MPIHNLLFISHLYYCPCIFPWLKMINVYTVLLLIFHHKVTQEVFWMVTNRPKSPCSTGRKNQFCEMSWFLLPSPKWPPRQLWNEVKTWEQKHLSKALGSSVISKLKAEWATQVRSKAPSSCYNSDPREDGELKLGQDPWAGAEEGFLRGRGRHSLSTNHVKENLWKHFTYIHHPISPFQWL